MFLLQTCAFLKSLLRAQSPQYRPVTQPKPSPPTSSAKRCAFRAILAHLLAGSGTSGALGPTILALPTGLPDRLQSRSRVTCSLKTCLARKDLLSLSRSSLGSSKNHAYRPEWNASLFVVASVDGLVLHGCPHFLTIKRLFIDRFWVFI